MAILYIYDTKTNRSFTQSYARLTVKLKHYEMIKIGKRKLNAGNYILKTLKRGS